MICQTTWILAYSKQPMLSIQDDFQEDLHFQPSGGRHQNLPSCLYRDKCKLQPGTAISPEE